MHALKLLVSEWLDLAKTSVHAVDRVNDCLLLLGMLLLTSSGLMSTALAVADGQREVYLSVQDFNQTLDRSHAKCASIDLDLSQVFYDCLEQRMKGIYVDSRTVR